MFTRHSLNRLLPLKCYCLKTPTPQSKCGFLTVDCSSQFTFFHFYVVRTYRSIFSQLAGYALSSVEGRVAMEFFDLSEAGQAKK